MMDHLRELVGVERSVSGVSQAMHILVTGLHAPVVGTMHITCADESETECVNAFQRGFVRYFVPALKVAEHSSFRLANLGGRYEWGAIRIAEQHYATAESYTTYKLLVVKLNSHVGVIETEDGNRFGMMKRYHMDSPCCGALHQLLEGEHHPYVRQLGEAFASEGNERVSTLLDDQLVDPVHRSLLAAVVSARLQARRVVLDFQDYEPLSPTQYLVVPCVTINRPERDTEIVCGYYWAEDPQQPHSVEYFGLGDDPAGYELQLKNGQLVITDAQVAAPRQARNHRQLVLEEYHRRMTDLQLTVDDDRFERVRGDVAQSKHRDHRQAKALLGVVLLVLAEVQPVSAAVLLFAHGIAGIHHAFRAHRLVRKLEGSDEARQMLNEIHDQVDRLDPKHAEAIIELLMREYRR